MRNIALFFAVFLLFASCEKEAKFDILILNGKVLDGSGTEPYSSDIGIAGDSIVFIGHASDHGHTAHKIIDAKDYFVTPGFIDTHTHTIIDLSDSLKKANLNFLLQGVTTVVAGSDGNSVVQIGEKLEEWTHEGIGTNAALMVGHRSIRRRVMGMRDDPPTQEEMNNMSALVEKGMKEGALGFSTGLYYAPASFSSTEEVIHLAKIAAENGGIFDSHIRDESSYNIGLLAAIDESIEIARKANVHVNISHIKCLGVDVWDKSTEVTQKIEKAREEGLRITADQYPYRASGTSLGACLVPKWAFAGDRSFGEKMDDPELAPKIREGMKENMRRRGGPSSLLLTFTDNKQIRGKNLAEIAQLWQKSPLDCAIEILREGGRQLLLLT